MQMAINAFSMRRKLVDVECICGNFKINLGFNTSMRTKMFYPELVVCRDSLLISKYSQEFVMTFTILLTVVLISLMCPRCLLCAVS